jgi:lactaldehyde dehydrogenase/glycolaldehyde dehydrogenase
MSTLPLTAAQRAQGDWARLPAIRRAAYLREIAQLIRANKEALARRITEEQGKVLLLEGRPALGRRSRSFS